MASCHNRGYIARQSRNKSYLSGRYCSNKLHAFLLAPSTPPLRRHYPLSSPPLFDLSRVRLRFAPISFINENRLRVAKCVNRTAFEEFRSSFRGVPAPDPFFSFPEKPVLKCYSLIQRHCRENLSKLTSLRDCTSNFSLKRRHSKI